MAGCRAFLFPGLEDFGIVPVQVQAAGRPVIAYAGGGALDTVIPGKTGELFADLTVDSLADALARFDAAAYDADTLQAHARRFDSSVFRRELSAFVVETWNSRGAGGV